MAFHVIMRTTRLHRVAVCGEVCSCLFIQNDHLNNDDNASESIFNGKTIISPLTTFPLDFMQKMTTPRLYICFRYVYTFEKLLKS